MKTNKLERIQKYQRVAQNFFVGNKDELSPFIKFMIPHYLIRQRREVLLPMLVFNSNMVEEMVFS